MSVAASILETEYVPSKLNVACDGLSRGIPRVYISLAPFLGYFFSKVSFFCVCLG